MLDCAPLNARLLTKTKGLLYKAGSLYVQALHSSKTLGLLACSALAGRALFKGICFTVVYLYEITYVRQKS